LNATSLESGVNRLDCVEEQRLGARRRYDSPIAPTFLGLEHLARVNSVPYRNLASLQGALLLSSRNLNILSSRPTWKN
jgi:hypothetical protein